MFAHKFSHHRVRANRQSTEHFDVDVLRILHDAMDPARHFEAE